MQLSLEILDHIFSFLVSHRETLIACSKDPVLSPIVERHLYYNMVIYVGHEETDPDYAYEPNHLSQLVSKNPRILNYVRILQIHVDVFSLWDIHGSISKTLEEFSKLLFSFPVLECIMLTSSKDRGYVWSWSPTFRAALEDCLKLSTVKEIHLTGCGDFPLSILDNCKSINDLTLLGEFYVEDQFCDSVLPRLRSLRLFTQCLSSSLLNWLKLHIDELQSLTCGPSSMEVLSKLLGVCSGTLKDLKLDLRQSPYPTEYTFRTGGIHMTHLPQISPVPTNLQQLSIYAAVCLPGEHMPKCCVSYLPAAAEAINSFISSPRLGHLILDIDINLSTFSHFTKIDFSPLAVLGPASLSIPRIDLYIHTGIFPSALTRAQLLSSLGEYGDIVRSIEEGILVIHSEKTHSEIGLHHHTMKYY